MNIGGALCKIRDDVVETVEVAERDVSNTGKIAERDVSNTWKKAGADFSDEFKRGKKSCEEAGREIARFRDQAIKEMCTARDNINRELKNASQQSLDVVRQASEGLGEAATKLQKEFQSAMDTVKDAARAAVDAQLKEMRKQFEKRVKQAVLDAARAIITNVFPLAKAATIAAIISALTIFVGEMDKFVHECTRLIQLASEKPIDGFALSDDGIAKLERMKQHARAACAPFTTGPEAVLVNMQEMGEKLRTMLIHSANIVLCQIEEVRKPIRKVQKSYDDAMDKMEKAKRKVEAAKRESSELQREADAELKRAAEAEAKLKADLKNAQSFMVNTVKDAVRSTLEKMAQDAIQDAVQSFGERLAIAAVIG